MADFKHFGKAIGVAVGSTILPGVGTVIGGAVGAMFDSNEDSNEEEQFASECVDAWSEFIPDMRNYRLQDRKAIMFLPKDDISIIWNSRMPGDCEIAYIPYSFGLPEGITIEGNHLEEGVLYVYDPRNEFHFYKASEISQVLIKDKFREIKHVFESLGATRIDITFSALKDEKSEYTSNNSQNISGHYGVHKASAGHSGSQGGTTHTSNFRQLEIHKQCTGKTSHINLNNCYWYQNDVIFQDEVRSIKAGSTLETNFVDTTKSYSSITSTSMDKIEAEYEYMGSIGVSGMAQWDYSKMQEISHELVWDVHVVYDVNKNNSNSINNNMLEANDWAFDNWLGNASAEELKPYVYAYDFSADYDPNDEIQERWMRVVDFYAYCLSEGVRGAEIDYQEAFRLLNITVNVGGRIMGHCNLAEMYELNKGINLDFPKARDLYELVLCDAMENNLNDSPCAKFAEERLNVMEGNRDMFSMAIGNVVTPDSGRGIVVTGKVVSGVVSIGDDILIFDGEGQGEAMNNLKPTDFMINQEDNTRVNSAKVGDTIVMHIEGNNIKVSDVERFELPIACSVNFDPGKLDLDDSCDEEAGDPQNQCFSEEEQEYLEEYKEILAEGEIRERDRRSLERLRNRLGISASRATELETSVGQSSLSEEEQEYLDEYREIIAEGDIRDRDRRALERLAQRNGISPSRAKEIERLA